jgi:hypothetical protein
MTNVCQGPTGAESLRQALSRLAVGSGLGTTRPVSLRDAMRNQPSHRASARVVGAEHLSQEDP